MTTAQDDLKEVNTALRELVRLQLAGELPAEAAWQARRQMLDSVEMAWHDLSQDLTPEAQASKQELTAPVVPRVSLRERWQQRPKLALPLSIPSLSLPLLVMPRWRLSVSKVQVQQVFSMLARLPWWVLFLLAALSSFYYVSTL